MSTSAPDRPGTHRRSRLAAAVSGIFALAGSLALTAVPAAADERPVAFDHGHIDAFNLTLVDGAPALNLKEDVTGSHVPHDPELVNLVVKDEALTAFPDGASYASYFPEELLGKTAHYLPLTQDPTLLWPGWDSLQLGSAWNTVDIHITDVDGPGEIFVWSQGSFGDKRPLLNGGSYQLPGTIHQSALAHVHANWAFTQPGEYLLTVSADVSSSATGAAATTNEATYLFTVGAQTPPTSVTLSGLAESYLPGDTVELLAQTDVSLKNATYRWESSLDGSAWSQVPDQVTDTYRAPVQDGQQLRAVITARSATVTSAPVTTIELAAGNVVIQGLTNPYLPGDVVELTAVTDADLPGATYRWETSPDGLAWSELSDQTAAELSVPAVDAQQIRVTHLSGSREVTAQPVVVELVDLPTTLTVTGLLESYLPGQDVVLEAKPDILVDGGVFAWETSDDSSNGWTPVAGAAGSVLTTPAFAGQRIRATYTTYGQNVVSEPVTVRTDAPSPTSLTIEGLQPSYELGESVRLSAVTDIQPDEVTYRWETSTDASTWTPVAGQLASTLTLPATDGEKIRVVASGNGWSLTSPSVTVSVATAGPQLPTSVAVTGLKSSYQREETVTLTAVTDEPAPGAAYAWQAYTTPLIGQPTWNPIAGQTSATYSATARDGQRLRVVATVGEQTLTSQPVTVVVTQAPPGQCWATDLDHGHVDTFSLGLGGPDKLPILELKEDVTGQRVARSPQDVNLLVKEDALTTLPAVAGVPTALHDRPAYYLPLTQDADLLWPGWDSLELAPGGWQTVDIDVTGVEGPGEVYLWSSSSFGGATALLNDGRFQLPGTIHQGALAHVHSNWAFTEPGAYFITVTATAHKGDVSHTTNTATYLFTVGDADLPPDYRDCVAPPAADPLAPDSTELTDSTRGGLTLAPSQVRAGEQVRVDLPADGVATVAAFLHSDPTLVTDGWVRTDAEGSFLVTVPRSTEPGAHRLSVVDAGNQLAGWADLKVLPARADVTRPPTTPPPGAPGAGDTPGTGGATGPGGGKAAGDASAPSGGGSAGSGTPPVCLPVTGSAAAKAPAPAPAPAPGAGGAAAPAPTGEVVVGSEGHFDFGPVVQDGEFQIQVKDDRTAPPVWRQPESVVFDVGEPALRKAADIPAELNFVAPAGQDVYMIQQIQEVGIPWIGFNTQHETIVNGPGAQGATLTLDKAEGPGEVAIFLNGNFGQLVGQRVVDTVGGPTSYTIPANTHQHGNWVFTEAGVYTVTFTIAADGESATSTLRFAVGQSDPAAAGKAGAAAAAPAADGSTEAEKKPAAGQGKTASGQSCTLASTGVDTDPAALALAGAIAVLVGAVLHVAAKRRTAHGRREPA
ncbi:hypothetical protein C8046_03490 [Serinibacter arcticus]|uniref:Surface-anchored protein n=1 Tax=Serinibacter arcticus TaxID=1655435 RepID=A0A2U1ZSB9_9MICO|nr:TIGR03773 family transporter-associated surface protein [Serinibacter arcticus]PWD49884.1 hypothetical protein C8046_03490 [Serinibacter arcticus]